MIVGLVAAKARMRVIDVLSSAILIMLVSEVMRSKLIPGSPPWGVRLIESQCTFQTRARTFLKPLANEPLRSVLNHIHLESHGVSDGWIGQKRSVLVRKRKEGIRKLHFQIPRGYSVVGGGELVEDKHIQSAKEIAALDIGQVFVEETLIVTGEGDRESVQSVQKGNGELNGPFFSYIDCFGHGVESAVHTVAMD
jgi:hypothetical protein